MTQHGKSDKSDDKDDGNNHVAIITYPVLKGQVLKFLTVCDREAAFLQERGQLQGLGNEGSTNGSEMSIGLASNWQMVSTATQHLINGMASTRWRWCGRLTSRGQRGRTRGGTRRGWRRTWTAEVARPIIATSRWRGWREMAVKVIRIVVILLDPFVVGIVTMESRMEKIGSLTLMK